MYTVTAYQTQVFIIYLHRIIITFLGIKVYHPCPIFLNSFIPFSHTPNTVLYTHPSTMFLICHLFSPLQLTTINLLSRLHTMITLSSLHMGKQLQTASHRTFKHILLLLHITLSLLHITTPKNKHTEI